MKSIADFPLKENGVGVYTIELFLTQEFVIALLILLGIVYLTTWYFKQYIQKTIMEERLKLIEQNEAHNSDNTCYINVELNMILDSINHVCTHQKLYLNPKLKISDLAKNTGYSINTISYALNQGLAKNFNDYINEYRVKEFINRIKTESNRYTILGTALDCGFNSKSSFYRIFNKHVGSSPQEYIRDYNESKRKQIV